MKKEIEERDNSIHNLENRCKTMEGNLKVENKRIKKERQRPEKQEYRVKLENIEKEENDEIEDEVDFPNVPTINKFETLQSIASDPSEDVERFDKKECASQTDVFECDTCKVVFLLETSLKDHTKRKHKTTSESETQTSANSKISAFQQTDDEKTEYENYSCFYCKNEITTELQKPQACFPSQLDLGPFFINVLSVDWC